jgi:hypothetical protein
LPNSLKPYFYNDVSGKETWLRGTVLQSKSAAFGAVAGLAGANVLESKAAVPHLKSFRRSIQTVPYFKENSPYFKPTGWALNVSNAIVSVASNNL